MPVVDVATKRMVEPPAMFKAIVNLKNWAGLCALLSLGISGNAGEPYDFIIKEARIIDGTGAPWYHADLAIDDGRIVKIGRLAGVGADRVIEAEGMVVAPGFIDMMGQTATPLLDDPKAAKNILTQGITTINAGEGISAAPIQEEQARSEGWSTMAEYFQLLELRGLPVNVVQTVGHTQVRRIVMGDKAGKPSTEELAQMQSLVREAMEAGAIGVSTALIYPPAVYADTDEIGALAEVAGEYGGRYYTHMRNEGDFLLEAIDEALEIGRKGKTPVHIFHLKAAGQGNWPKMEKAIRKIKDARSAGEQVTADIYPYINNGLGISSMVHPRHFAEGRAAFLKQIEDEAFRLQIREEMESNEGEWENWFKHIDRDWNRLVVGRINSLRLMDHKGKSLSAIAEETGMDPWDVFFELLKTDAFVLPESMSETNKIRLMQEEFISFCTDVGPSDGSGGASHPRAFGSFPRILGYFVREKKAVSLERAIAQASAVAANDVFAYDRGRIAEGLVADVIIFDPEKVIDKATFEDPHALSEGMQYVFVNGSLVLEGGEVTGQLPGKVLRGPGYDEAKAPHSVSAGDTTPELGAIDLLMSDFMEHHGIPGASLAVTHEGRLVYARGFGYADLAKKVPVTPESLFRIASISKPVTAAGIFKLVDAGKLKLDDRIFELLDSYEPVDPEGERDERLANITILHLLQHSGGWDRDASFDAMFRSVPFAEALDLPPPAEPDAIIRNMLNQPLDFDPGSRYAYSNFGYCLLGRLIEKISGTSYEAFVKENVLDPAEAHTMVLGRSLPEYQKPNEVRYYSPYRGPSVFADNLGEKVPYHYGGWNLEAMDSHGGWLASAVDLAKFAVLFDQEGEQAIISDESVKVMFARPEGGPDLDDAGKPKAKTYSAGWGRVETESGPVFSHSGALAGTSTLLVRRPDGNHWVVLFNARSGARSNFFPYSLQSDMDAVIDAIDSWPEIDLFLSSQTDASTELR